MEIADSGGTTVDDPTTGGGVEAGLLRYVRSRTMLVLTVPGPITTRTGCSPPAFSCLAHCPAHAYPIHEQPSGSGHSGTVSREDV